MQHLVGRILIDKDGAECSIVEATSTSINVLIAAKTPKGITCTCWFADEKKTWDRFTLKP